MFHGEDIYGRAMDPVVMLVIKTILLTSLHQYKKSYRVNICKEKKRKKNLRLTVAFSASNSLIGNILCTHIVYVPGLVFGKNNQRHKNNQLLFFLPFFLLFISPSSFLW